MPFLWENFYATIQNTSLQLVVFPTVITQTPFLWENFAVAIQNTSLQPVVFPTDFAQMSFLWEKLPVRQNPHYLKNLLIVKKCFIYYIVGT